MKKIIIITLVIASSIIYITSCKRETSLETSNSIGLINKANIWFTQFLQREKLDSSFLNVKYQWDKASIFKFKNGYEIVTVPVFEKNQNPAYTGRRILYLYPWKNGKGFYTTVYELLPDVTHLQKNKGNIDLKLFTGFVSTWDLKKGFYKGIMYSDGIAVDGIKIEAHNSKLGFRTTVLPGPLTPLPSPNWGVYFVTVLNGLGYNVSSMWNTGYGGSNPCEYTSCNYENLYDYIDEGLLNEIYHNYIDQLWTDSILDSTNSPCIADILASFKTLDNKLPKLVRSFFNCDAGFNINLNSNTVLWKNDTPRNVSYPPAGAATFVNLTSRYNVFMNNYYSDATDLAKAATLIHEAMHCQIYYWNQNQNNQYLKDSLYKEYGYIFGVDTAFTSSLTYAASSPTNQHQDMATKYIQTLGDALYQYAVLKGIAVDLNYCRDLAWTGCVATPAFNNLSFNNRTRILETINAEKDPNSTANHTFNGVTYSINTNGVSTMGKTPCQ